MLYPRRLILFRNYRGAGSAAALGYYIGTARYSRGRAPPSLPDTSSGRGADTIGGRRARCWCSGGAPPRSGRGDRKSTRLNSSHTEIYTLSLHDALPISTLASRYKLRPGRRYHWRAARTVLVFWRRATSIRPGRSEEHTSELQSHRDLHSFPTRRSSDLHPRFQIQAQAGAQIPLEGGAHGAGVLAARHLDQAGGVNLLALPVLMA